MTITECTIKLAPCRPAGRDHLAAFATIVVDDALIVRDLKVIRGAAGLFVAMPSRRLVDRCPECGANNHLEAAWCNRCGFQLDAGRATRGAGGTAKLHADVCHPIDATARAAIEAAVLAAYRRALEAAAEAARPDPAGRDDDGGAAAA